MDVRVRVADWAGRPLSRLALGVLDRYEDWLRDEALPAGGLGPAEGARLRTRHLADSLTFAKPWQGKDAPESLVDLGSGVGLPGIPLAVALPDSRVTLVDRSGRRVRLLERAVRVLDLDNVEVIQGDIATPSDRFAGVVSRATIPPDRFAALAGGWSVPGGTVVVGGSTRARPDVAGWRVLEVPTEILDSGGWLLIMDGPVRRSRP